METLGHGLVAFNKLPNGKKKIRCPKGVLSVKIEDGFCTLKHKILGIDKTLVVDLRKPYKIIAGDLKKVATGLGLSVKMLKKKIALKIEESLAEQLPEAR